MSGVRAETMRLLRALASTQELKEGSAEREHRQDAIYARLSELATEIKSSPQASSDPESRELYHLITQTPLVQSGPTVARLPIYTDEHKMFVRTKQDPKVQVFLGQMATGLRLAPSAQAVEETLGSVFLDGSKVLLERAVFSPRRKKWLKSASKTTCTGCWTSIMRHLMRLLGENFALEIKRRSTQVRQMLARNHLSRADAVSLLKDMDRAVVKVDKIVQTAFYDKLRSRQEWVEMAESIYAASIGVINELMVRYMHMTKMQGG